MDDYFITAKEEVLREVGSIIMADILKYMVDHNIECHDSKNPISILCKKVSEMSDALVQNVYHTMEELEMVSAQFKFIKEYFGEIKNGCV